MPRIDPIVETLADFDALKDRLADYGFTRTGVPHRLKHRDGGLMDLLPFSESIEDEERTDICERFRWYRLGTGL